MLMCCGAYIDANSRHYKIGVAVFRVFGDAPVLQQQKHSLPEVKFHAKDRQQIHSRSVSVQHAIIR